MFWDLGGILDGRVFRVGKVTGWGLGRENGSCQGIGFPTVSVERKDTEGNKTNSHR